MLNSVPLEMHVTRAAIIQPGVVRLAPCGDVGTPRSLRRIFMNTGHSVLSRACSRPFHIDAFAAGGGSNRGTMLGKTSTPAAISWTTPAA